MADERNGFKRSLAPVTGKTSSADDLEVSAFITDPDQDEVNVEIQWRRDGVEVKTRELSTKNLAMDTLSANETQRGQQWTVSAKVNDGETAGTPAEKRITIGNAPPRLVAVNLSPQPAYTNSVIIATPQGWVDPDGDEAQYTYEWYVDDIRVPTQMNDALPESFFSKYQSVYARVSPTDGMDAGPAVQSISLRIANSVPSISGVRVSPSRGNSSTVFECIPEGWEDPDEDPADYQFQWYVNGNASVTTSSIGGTAFQRGDEISCEAWPFDGEEAGTPEMAASIRISGACGPSEAYGETCWPIVPTNIVDCYNETFGSSAITCPGTAGSPSCGSTPFCGQDGQYPDLELRTFTCIDATGQDLATCPNSATNGESVRDELTGLTWQRTIPPPNGNGWQAAMDDCHGLSYGTHSDWRLPTFHELRTLIDYSDANPISTEFPFVTLSGPTAWSSSTWPHPTQDWAWLVNLQLNQEFRHFGDPKTSSSARSVWCVRGGSGNNAPTNRFTQTRIQNEDVVNDRLTGLMWQFDTVDNKSWREALGYCESLNYAGYDDWRLPNINSLASLYDEGKTNPASDFPGMIPELFWSSTTVLVLAPHAWMVDFRRDFIYDFGLYFKFDGHNVRCVR